MRKPSKNFKTGVVDKMATTNTDDVASQDEELESAFLPPKPTPPLPTDCCGSGCTPCVNDLYDRELSLWLKLNSMSLEERREWYSGRNRLPADRHSVAMNPEAYNGFELVAVKQVSSDSSIYSFHLPKDTVLGVGVGQHIVLRVKNKDGGIITRQYTPISPMDQTGHFNIVIKIYNKGEASQVIREWSIGIMTEWRGPFGRPFSYHPNKLKLMIMFACGTGIAPFIQIIRTVLSNEEDYTRLYLLYSSKTQRDILCKETLDEFKEYWNFTVEYFLTQSTPSSLESDKGYVRYNDNVKFQRINETAIADLMRGHSSLQIMDHLDQLLCLVCGTRSFNKDITNFLLRLSLKNEQILIF